MKLGDTPLVEYTRDRLHRETLRRFGRYELTTAYTPAGQLQSQHLNSLLSDRDYTERQRRTHPHQQPAPDPELQLQHHRQADQRSHHRSESGYPHPVCHGPGGQPPARPGAAPGQRPQHVAG
ncbi:hypothetical protein ECZU18_08250 [Escherichia coli]|nr:hypothetical protein ECZU18_08250 [Escherichia coli]